ncbi:uncharacterized protein F4812DRAFT_267491 [Daldinia caldariorum]|uniref:uncharacterized protein n=1 Tax=Daldinia caldariorum TaxID=326644 RepID=UPI002007BD54|nr:uncharacterized protein F4812DRAFT_267491 [Daldinia caldariorum]KAI1470474.1 hypothetical protein F4812DRAFT_267491 [Daldinia caldariorum]
MLSDRQPRRRRRPALSCIECRRRKIKCNRTEPCRHCVSAKLKCIYKVYNDEPVNQFPLRPGVSPLESSSSSSHAPSPSTSQAQELGATRPTSEHDANAAGFQVVEPWAGAVLGCSSKGSQNDGPNTIILGLDRSSIQPHIPTPEADSGAADTPQRGQNASNKSSVPSSITGLSENGRDILARQLGLKDSQIILNKTRVLGWTLRLGITQEFTPIVSCYVAAANAAKGTMPQDTEKGALYAQIWALLQKCKNIGRSIKLGRPSRWLSYPNFDLAPPPREVADAMATLYFQSFESTHRIIHPPTFWEEYQRFWDHPETVTTSLRLKTLLVIGIGSSVSDHTESNPGFRNTVHQWVYAAQMWLSGPLEKDRLNVTGIQIFCLVILARQVFSIGGDLVWVSSGSLMNMAMQIGLHRDPKHLPRMSILQAELRRRLWATILEITVQSSLDSAMLPRISLDDFDTEAPSNVNDDELKETTMASPPHAKSIYTSTSLQLILLDLLPIRLRILQLLNGLHSELSYVDTLALSSELTDKYRSYRTFIRDSEKAGVTPFHRNLLDNLVRRFLIPLHCPFAGEARTNPLFYYSLKVTVDSAMTLISPEPDEGFSRLMSTGGGMFREAFRSAMIVITRELLTQIEAQRSEGIGHRNSQDVETFKKAVKEMTALSIERIRQGETNVKGPMFLSMIMAQVEAIEEGIPCDLRVAQSAKESLELCVSLLEERAGTVSSPCPSNIGLTPNSLDPGYGMDLDFDFESLMTDSIFT